VRAAVSRWLKARYAFPSTPETIESRVSDAGINRWKSPGCRPEK
jgi:hypothetical protein